LPYPRVIHSLKSGKINFAVLIDSPNIGAEVIKGDHLLRSNVILVGASGAQKITSLSALAGKRVGHIRASKYGKAFDEADYFVKYPVNSLDRGLAMLMVGRLDALVSLDDTLYFAMGKMAIAEDAVGVMMKLGEVSVSLYMSATAPREDLFLRYSQEISKMRESGRLRELFSLRQSELSPSYDN
jgi:polar amino acid transport system substrate-binding protein